jgi:hypothetical protein
MPMHKKEIMIIKGLCDPRKIIVPIAIEPKPNSKSFLFPIRSAIMPIGIVKMVELSALIIDIDPIVDPLNPSDVK